MKILVATSNTHKLDEIRSVMGGAAADSESDLRIEMIGLDALHESISEPLEDQDTFEGNAALKARYYAKASALFCLADDSGLEADALNGEPGVYSARYAGATGPRSIVDAANNRLLLEKMADVPAEHRTARFVCAMALAEPPDSIATGLIRVIEADPKGRILALVRGTVEGRMLALDEVADPSAPERGRGHNGFGYDPLFLVPKLGRTTAELTPEQKNSISHRGHAARLMWEQITRILTN